MIDVLGNEMKALENAFEIYLDKTKPIIVRLDGRAFHSFTKNLERPFCHDLVSLMRVTTKFMMKELNAQIGYTQSDEISLISFPKEGAQLFFSGRVQKLCSILASSCSLFFNQELPRYLPSKVGTRPMFDCRVWNVSDHKDVYKTLLWRIRDARKNSISMVAQSMFSQDRLHGLHSDELIQLMILEKNYNWNNALDSDLKFGSLFQQKKAIRPFLQEEIEKLPEKHKARSNSSLLVERSEIVQKFAAVCNDEELYAFVAEFD